MSGSPDWPADAGPVLTGLARAAIAERLGGGRAAPSDRPEWLREPGAAFVTLTAAGRLRGCIGSLVAHRPLGEDVAANARAAAFDDPRFAPVRAGELAGLHIEVSVLSPPTPMTFAGKADALAQLRPGVDGVILKAGYHRATFLPQVWEELPEPEQFIAHLMAKAGLPAHHWDDGVSLDRYTVTAFDEVA